MVRQANSVPRCSASVRSNPRTQSQPTPEQGFLPPACSRVEGRARGEWAEWGQPEPDRIIRRRIALTPRHGASRLAPSRGAVSILLIEEALDALCADSTQGRRLPKVEARIRRTWPREEIGRIQGRAV